MGGWRLLLFYFIIVVVLGGWPNVEEGRTLAVRIIETRGRKMMRSRTWVDNKISGNLT